MRLTRAAALAQFFRARPGIWIDGRELAEVAGAYGWRSLVADLRRAPFLMVVQNQQKRRRAANGGTFIVSEYRYVPGVQESASL